MLSFHVLQRVWNSHQLVQRSEHWSFAFESHGLNVVQLCFTLRHLVFVTMKIDSFAVFLVIGYSRHYSVTTLFYSPLCHIYKRRYLRCDQLCATDDNTDHIYYYRVTARLPPQTKTAKRKLLYISDDSRHTTDLIKSKTFETCRSPQWILIRP